MTAMCASGAAVSWAEGGSAPLYVKNLGPVAGLLGLPSLRAANSQAVGSYSLALHSSIANHFVTEVQAPEQVHLDGETLRFALELRYGLAEHWDIQLEVPWLEHSGGRLDSVIESWHDLWGMSDGGRSSVDHDILAMRYLAPEVYFSFTDDATGLGDISVALNYAFYRDHNSAASAVVGYKFATGDEDELLGSGADDVFFALRFSGAHLADLPLSWHGQVGYLHAGNSEVLGSRQEENLWFAGLALDWAVADNVSLFAQLDMHAAPLDSDLTVFGSDAFLGALGARWSLGRHWSLDLSFIEDLQVETAPDITFQASIRYTGSR